METVNETVEEYLKRGGTITTLPPSGKRHTSLFVALNGMQGMVQEERKNLIHTLDSNGTYITPDTDKQDKKDKQYWKKMNKRLDELIREGKRKKRKVKII